LSTSGNGNGSKNAFQRWGGIALTAGLAILAFTVQWGVVTTKLDQVEKRLDELILEAKSLRSEYQSIQRRVSYLEGRVNAGAGARTGTGRDGQ
jgi:hypothetical protein